MDYKSSNQSSLSFIDYFKSYKIKQQTKKENNENLKKVNFSIESYANVIENIEKEFGDSKFFNKDITIDDVNFYVI